MELSLKQVVDAFDKAGLPIKDRIVYDERTDPNGLLGRPNRYVEKMNFNDARDKKNRRSLDSSIEVFKNPEDAEDRKKYLDAVGKASSIFASYSFLHRNVLVRISFGVVPSEAEAYKNILESINP